MFGEGFGPGARPEMLDFTAGGVGHENQPRPLETYRDGLFRREKQSSGAGKPGGKVQTRFLVAESVKNDSEIQPK